MAEDLIEHYINRAAFEADTSFAKTQLAELEASYTRLKNARVNIKDSTTTKDLVAGAKESSLVLEQLRIKNLELTNAIKEQSLAAKQSAEQRKLDAIAAKELAAAEKRAAAEAQVAGQQKIAALKAQQQAEAELAVTQEERRKTEMGTYEIPAGSGQTGTGNRNKIKEAAFVPANETEENLLFLTKTETALKANQATQKSLGEQLKANAISQEQYNAKIVEAKAAELEYKKQIQLTNAELRARTNAEFAIQGSIDAAKAQNALLVQQRNAIPVDESSTPEDLERIKQLNAEIDKNNELIDKNNDLLGRQKINIGNYPNAFGGAFKTLNKELDEVQGKLVSGNFKGAAFEELTAKANVLRNATELTGKTFASVGQQQKAYAEASTQIGLVYGKNSDIFKQFSSQVKDGNKTVSNLAKEVSNTAEKGKGFVGFLSTAYAGIRKLANIIPGAGIATIILMLLGPLQSAAAAVVKWSNSATKAGRDFVEFNRRVKETNEIVEKSVDSFSKATSEVLKLKEDVQLAKEGFLDKDKVLKEYNTTMGKVTGQLKSFDQLEAKIVEDGPAYIELLFLKAKATAAYALAGEAARKSLTAQADAEKEFSSTDFISTNKINLIKQAFGFGDLSSAGLAAAAQVKKNAAKIKEEQEKAFKSLNQQGDEFEKKAAALAKKRNFNIFDPETTRNAGKKDREEASRLADEFRKKDLEALAAYSTANLNILKDMYKEQYSDQNSSLEDRLTAIQKYFDVSLQLIQNSKKAQEDALNLEITTATKTANKIDDPKAKADALIAIEKYRVDKLATIEQEAAIGTSNIEKDLASDKIKINNDAYERIKKEAEAAYKFISEQAKIASENERAEVDVRADEAILALQEALRNKSIKSIEDYNRRKEEIEKNAALEKEKINLRELEAAKVLFNALYGPLGFLNPELEKKIAEAKIRIGESSVDAQQKTFDKEKDIAQKRAELAHQLDETITGIVGNRFDAEKARTEEQIEAIETKAQKEIDAINASTLAEDEKAKKIKIIEERSAAQRQQLENKERQQDLQRAIFERAAASLRIVANTAVAVTADLKTPWKIPYDIGMGAAQLALVMSQPLPRFRFGKNNNYEGPAIVGDGGQPEFIKRSDGTIEKTPARDTLTFLKKEDVVYPNFNAMMLSLAMPKIKALPVDHHYENKILAAELRKQTPLLAKIANKRENHISAKDGALVSLWKYGASSTKYIDENTNW